MTQDVGLVLPTADKDFKSRCFYSALMEPFFKYTVSKKSKKKAPTTAIEHILNESIKRGQAPQKFVLATIEHTPLCSHYAHADFAEIMADDQKKLELGHYLRLAGHHWPSTVLLAACKDLYNKEEGVAERYRALNDSLKEANLDNVHMAKPLADGKMLSELYGIKPGKIMGPLKEEVINF